MTLIEVLVTCSILGLLTAIVAMALRPGLAAWRRSQVKGDLQGNALLSMHALSHSISRGRSRGIVLFPRVHRTDDGAEIPIDGLAVIETADTAGSPPAPGPSGAPAEGPSAVAYFIDETRHELWQARFKADAPALGGSGEAASGGSPILPPTVTAALEGGTAMPTWLGEQRRIGRNVSSLRVERLSKGYHIAVTVSDTSMRCALETTVTPVLDALDPSTASASPSPQASPTAPAAGASP